MFPSESALIKSALNDLKPGDDITFLEHQSFYYSISLKNTNLTIKLKSIFLDNFNSQFLINHLKNSIFPQAQSIQINPRKNDNHDELSLTFDFNSLNDNLKDKLSRLDLYCFSIIFQESYSPPPCSLSSADGTCDDDFILTRLDSMENVFTKIKDNRLTSITSLTIKDPERFLILKRFLQEWAYLRKLPDKQDAPSIIVNIATIPRELSGFTHLYNQDNNGDGNGNGNLPLNSTVFITQIFFENHTRQMEIVIDKLFHLRSDVRYYCQKFILNQNKRLKKFYDDMMMYLNARVKIESTE